MKKIFNFILGLILIIGIGYGFYSAINYLIEILMSLQKEVAAAIIAAMATIIVSILSITIGKYYEQKIVIEKELREEKIPMYEDFIKFLLNLLLSNKVEGKQMTQDEMVTFFNKFTQKLIVWGSDEVVSQWSKYRRKITQNPADTKTSMIELEKLLLAIRKDTGHKNKAIHQGELLGLFINDIDNYIENAT